MVKILTENGYTELYNGKEYVNLVKKVMEVSLTEARQIVTQDLINGYTWKDVETVFVPSADSDDDSRSVVGFMYTDGTYSAVRNMCPREATLDFILEFV